MNLDEVSPELREKALDCKTTEELCQLAQEAGIELTDEQIEAFSGGGWATPVSDGHACAVIY